MTITTKDYVSVRERSEALGCALPNGIVLLPDNFETAQPGEDLRFQSKASTTRKLLLAAGLQADRLSPQGDQTVFIHNRSFDLVVPAMFIGTELLKQNPDVVSVALDLVRDYAKELFGSTDKSRNITTEIVVEDKRSGRCKKVKYEGDVEGLREVAKLVRNMQR